MRGCAMKGGMTIVPIRIDRRIWLPLAMLPEDVAGRLRRVHVYPNPAFKKMANFLARHPKGKWMTNNEPEQYTSYSLEDGYLSLPRGSMPVVRSTLRSAGLDWRIEDQRSEGSPKLRFTRKLVHRPDPKAPDGGALRWYQTEAIQTAVNKQNCLLRAPTGSGKTTTAIGIIAAVQVPTLIVVWTGVLLDQWADRLQRELGLRPDEIGLVGGGKRVLRPITLAMQQSLVRAPDSLFGQFGLVIADEVQRYAATTFTKVIERFPAKYRIGVSTDETRKDRKEFLIYDAFGDVAHEVTQDELVQEGSVLDVTCELVPTDFQAPWYVEQVQAGLNVDMKRLLDEMVANEPRTQLALQLVLDDVQQGHQVLVLSHRIEHCRIVAKMLQDRGIKAGLMLGGADHADELQATSRGLGTGELQVGVGTVQAVGVGVDIPSLARGVLMTPIGNNRQLFAQIRGRLCRKGKGDAVLRVLWDQHVSGVAVVKNMTRWNRAMYVMHDGARVAGRAYLKTLKETADE